MTGVVTDPSGALIPDTAVVLTNPHTNVTFTTKTDSKGSYRFTNVPPGPGYMVTFTHDGFSATRINNIALAVANTRTQDAKLNVGAAQTVEVSASGSDVTINTTDATVGNNINPEVINQLPVQARDTPSALFTLEPGVTLGGSTTGSRVDQDQVTVDGLDVNDMATGQNFAIVAQAPVDAMQQFTGTVSGFNVSSGPGGGGQFQLVTKGGTNHFHGNINEYHRDAALAANSWFGDHQGLAKPNYIRNQFGGNIGGPVWKDRAFFFFNLYDSRITQSALVNRVVPLNNFRSGNIGYVNNGPGCDRYSRQDTTPPCISYYSPAQVAALDPLAATDPAHAGEDQAFLTYINSAYPQANNPAGGGDGINTGFYTFNTPEPDSEINYTSRVDFNLTRKHRLYAFETVNHVNSVESAPEFPGQPYAPYLDRSFRWGVVDEWAINPSMANQVSYGQIVSDLQFPIPNINPNGDNLLTFSDGITSFMSDPVLSPSNAQGRRIPINQLSDNFQWQKGSHSIQLGGFFKLITSFDHTTLDYNSASIGLGGYISGLSAGDRPTDIAASTTAQGEWDYAFAAALGRVGAIGQQFNYDNKGNALPLATGDQRHYRYYQSEIYAGDSWKVTPSLTLSYGVNWQYYSVPYETNGLESVGQIQTGSGSAVPFTFDQYFSDRLQAANTQGPFAVPLIQYVLGGKANNGPSYYQPDWHDFAPRFAFAYSPSWDRNSVINGGIGLVYDRTIVNAVQYQQDQHNYLFQQSVTQSGGDLATDQRLGANATYVAPNAPPAAKSPFTPFVDNATGDLNGTPNLPYGLQNGQAFNTMIDSKFKTPYNIIANLGVQHQFPAGFVMRLNYAGRFGRRLLAQADANQVLDNSDPVSGQLLSQAMTNATLQARACNNTCAGNLTAQPWFENVAGPGLLAWSEANYGASLADWGVPNWTSWLASEIGNLIYNGDLADTVQAATGGYNYAQPYNAGMSPQFSENTVYTNKGFSSYNGLLVTLHKNMTHGLTFDFNYTFSHSIDNVSLVANTSAAAGYGFVCDVLHPRECRGNSDFDVTQIFNGYVNYELPFGHGREWANSTPWFVDWLIGGWDVSSIFNQHSGIAWGTVSSAFVPSYSNNAPAFFNGVNGDVRANITQNSSGQVNIFSKGTATASEFSGPVGFNVGSRNNLRGPGYFDMDSGLAKMFAISRDRGINLQLRGDFFNVLNHPNFATPVNPTPSGSPPNTDITSSSFGVITSMNGSARIGQVSARIDF
jgi:hypothetical protein